MFIGYEYGCNGYNVDHFGSYMGLEDLGRDLIVKKDGLTKIVQCKYWSKHKHIHEKHINQLFGTLVSYCIENNLNHNLVKGLFVTSTSYSKKAKEFASRLGIELIEHKKLEEFPRIKCNIGINEFGD